MFLYHSDCSPGRQDLPIAWSQLIAAVYSRRQNQPLCPLMCEPSISIVLARIAHQLRMRVQLEAGFSVRLFRVLVCCCRNDVVSTELPVFTTYNTILILYGRMFPFKY